MSDSGRSSAAAMIQLNPDDEIRVFIRLRDLKGRYVQHCHNTVHEDHGMMAMFEIV